MRLISAVLFTVLVATPAHAQRDAVSPDLSPEMAGQVFSRTVADVCVPAVSGNGVSALSAAQRGALVPTQDATTRKQAGAAVDETVWDVATARGVVTVREKAGLCVVSVYGSALTSTIEAAKLALMQDGFGAVTIAGEDQGASQRLLGQRDGRSVAVRLNGSQPGSPGHQSKFS